MKKFKIIIVSCCLFLLMVGCVEKHYNEWVKQGNNWYYYGANGSKVKNKIFDDGTGNLYAVDQQGRMLINTTVTNRAGDEYVIDENGICSLNLNIQIEGLKEYMYANDFYIKINNKKFKTIKDGDYYREEIELDCEVIKTGMYNNGSCDLKYTIYEAGYAKETSLLSSYANGMARGEKFKLKRDILLGNKKTEYIIKFKDEYNLRKYYK